MEFISDCRKAGIAPILGTELTLTSGHSIVLLAQNMRGYANLCCLITRLQAAPDHEASSARGLSLADLGQHTEDLIALSGGRSGPLDASLRERDAPRTEHIAREKQVPISPRGSASSSVVAYGLGIHDVDPIAHHLYFERFLSLERHDPPDIDLDMCSHRRDEVINYVYRQYGADHVAMICTYATLRARYALRQVGKAYSLSEARIKRLSDRLPGFWHAGARSQRPPVGKRMQDAQAELIEQAHDPVEREVLEVSLHATWGTTQHENVL